MPAVACGTNTCSSPSPPLEAALANSAHSPVMSATVSRVPVLTRMISLFIPHDRLPSVHMTEGPGSTGANLRLARQARGFSQQQLASMAGVSRQAVSAVESGHSDPSLRVALALAQALGMAVEELFGPGEPAAPVAAVSVAPLRGRTDRVALAPVGDRFVALPLRGDAGAGLGFLPAGGLANPANLAVAAVGGGQRRRRQRGARQQSRGQRH